MSALACIFGRHIWTTDRSKGLNGEIPTRRRCSTCGTTKDVKR